MSYFKILVCGSRDIRDKEFVFRTLDFLTSKRDLSTIEIIQGGQRSFDKHLEIYYGADYYGKMWAKERGVKMTEFLAPWDGLPDTPKKSMRKNKANKWYWPGAGMYRNKIMKDYGPNACVAFLGKNSKNSGTMNMLNLVKDMSILIRKYYI